MLRHFIVALKAGECQTDEWLRDVLSLILVIMGYANREDCDIAFSGDINKALKALKDELPWEFDPKYLEGLRTRIEWLILLEGMYSVGFTPDGKVLVKDKNTGRVLEVRKL